MLVSLIKWLLILGINILLELDIILCFMIEINLREFLAAIQELAISDDR